MTKVNPYNPGTQIYRIFEKLMDLKWHCSECELPGSQPAKALQLIRLDGYEMVKIGSNWEKRMFCGKCKRKTPHRKLVSLNKNKSQITRVSFSADQRKAIIKFYNGNDAILGYNPTGRAIEIDHRVPMVRWKKSEMILPSVLTYEEIEKRYMLLVREHNLLKSRYCEKCAKSGIRQSFLGIEYFYAGKMEYDDVNGCVGCGWHNPEKWKEYLNKVLKGIEK